ncbi:hypothetical protein M422DRAFT_253762 [Sphaerobolus stellatus SS14]|uniref:Uncharacterized protein n=1 Tax=Sphaerobolus stellatus (strain SS14) TaxID=990650 RepID=A0A0C9UIX2_SPHS4|nr:hypothetical protein M422DRAFT_253762 [Sphaerobolus stellatus SS14]
MRVAVRNGPHKGKVVAGCREQQDSCAFFMPLEKLYIHPDFYTAKYLKREIADQGILPAVKHVGSEFQASPVKYRRTSPPDTKGKRKAITKAEDV